MDKAQALHSFWSAFGIPAYDTYSVPDDAQLPYITYEVAVDNFGSPVAAYASLWYRSTSWQAITAKEKEIASAITRGGKLIKYTDGALWIRMSSPWAQRMNDPSDNMIKRMVLSIYYEFLD